MQEVAELQVRMPVMPAVRAEAGAPSRLDKHLARRETDVQAYKLQQQLASVAISGPSR